MARDSNPSPRPSGPRRAAAGISNARNVLPAARKRINYPRSDRTGAARFVPSGRQFLALILTGALAVVLLFGLAYLLIRVPSPNQFAAAETSIVYFADGETEIGRFAAQNRMAVGSEEIPESMKDATVAAEDRSFYENRGISPRGIARAFWSNLRGDSTQGGSTITQQYVKNYYLEADRTYTRKAREAVLAIKIDQQQSKDQILTNYLNTIYFGRGAYGVQMAAQAYFGKDAKDLTPQESALLAGVIPNPSNWDPAVDRVKAQQRFDYVVDSLVRAGHLSEDEAAQWEMPEAPEQEKQKDTYAGTNGYLLAEVRRELNVAGMSEQDLDGGGLRIVTTIDEHKQEAAVEMMDNSYVFPTRGRPDGLRAALVSIDPGNGAIVAMYGGEDYLEVQQNAATQAIVQAGSTFKPFALVAGLEDGISVRSTFNGASGIRFKGTNRPIQNFGGSSYGRINLVTATANSVNTVYVALNQRVGPEKTREVAVRAGLPEDTAGLDDYLGNVLGSASPRPVDMANAYATFAAEGVRHTPHIVDRVTKGETVVHTGPTAGEQVFEGDVMADTTYALRQVVLSGSGRPAAGLGRPAAGKTGTSSDNMSAWFVGYTPQLATAVTLFNTDEQGNPIKITGFGGRSEITGGSFPVRMWTSYMREALEDEPIERFPSFANVGRATGRAEATSGNTNRRSTRTYAPSTRTRTEAPVEEPAETEEPTSTATPTEGTGPDQGGTQTAPEGGGGEPDDGTGGGGQGGDDAGQGGGGQGAGGGQGGGQAGTGQGGQGGARQGGAGQGAGVNSEQAGDG